MSKARLIITAVIIEGRAQREAAVALGVRVAVHDSRQNDPNPVNDIWQPGQDYRAAEAIQAARCQPTRARWGPKRTGPER
jgi:hypothetical protein